jgi:hypothetical protein
MKLPNKVYDVLKWLALVFFDAFGLLYQTLANVWGLPYGEQVMKTCVAIALFIGTLIGVSCVQYYKDKQEEPTYGKMEDYTEE